MHINNYIEFINENNENKLARLRKQKERLAKKLDSAPERKKAKLSEQLSKIEKEIETVEKYLQKTGKVEEQPAKDEKEQSKEQTDTEQPEEKPQKLNRKQLQGKLDQWNSVYAGKFLFKDDMPKAVSKDYTLPMLLNDIAEGEIGGKPYTAYVKDGLTKLAKFLKNDLFDGLELSVIGNTSSTGSDEDNQSLSERRAEAVTRAIKDLMKDSDVNIEFKRIGMGEKDLIIQNDTDTKEPKIKSGVVMDNNTKKLIADSEEERQKINRRVKITLPEFKDKDYKITSPVTEEEREKKQELPEYPDPESISFNENSYILTKGGEESLRKFADSIKSYNTGDEKIKDIYLTAHTKRGSGNNSKKKQKRSDEMLAILSANRGIIVKDYLDSVLNKDKEDKIDIHVVPVAFYMGETKKVEFRFAKTEMIEKAEDIFKNMVSKYDIPSSGFEVDTSNIIENKPMRESLIEDLRAYAEAKMSKRRIPIELFYTDSKSRIGLGRENNLSAFKKKASKIVATAGRTLDEYVKKPS